MSDTPRTDAAEREGNKQMSLLGNLRVVLERFRQLERELAEARNAALEEVIKWVYDIEEEACSSTTMVPRLRALKNAAPQDAKPSGAEVNLPAVAAPIHDKDERYALEYQPDALSRQPSEEAVQDRRYTPEELLIVAERTFLPIDQKKRRALHDLTFALKQTDVIPSPDLGKGVQAAPTRKKTRTAAGKEEK